MTVMCSTILGSAYAASEPKISYKDVKESDWFAEAIGKLNALKIIDGLPDGSFNSQGDVTRAQFLKMLVQAMEYKKIDSVSFIDLKPYPSSKPHWASVYIETALRNGVIIKAEEGDRFFPDVPISREDMVMMMFRALKLEPSDGPNPYYDLAEPNGCFTKLYEEYLVRGIPMNGKIIFNPTGVTTRAQAAVIIARMVEYKEDTEGFKAKMEAEGRRFEETANGVPVRLYDYTEGTTTRDAKGTYEWTFKERNEAYYAKFEVGSIDRSGYLEVNNFDSVESFIKYQVDIAKRYMKYNWNVDYRNVGKAYIDGIGDTLSINSAYHAEKNVANFKKYKVKCESEFLTDYDLIYEVDGMATSVRGTLRIKFDKGTSQEFIKNTLKTDIETGKWYEIDMEVPLARGNKEWYVRKNNKYKILGVFER